MTGASLLALPWAALIFSIPLVGSPPTPAIIKDLETVPGVARVEAEDLSLRVEVAPGEMVRLREIARAIRRHTVRTEVDYDRLLLGAHTIFELDAGQCFECTEGPLRQRLSRKSFVRSWSVVDYAAKGRLRFRISPEGEVFLDSLGRLPFEDILLTGRYDGVEAADLYWPTGGVAWRESEEGARREATVSRKPLLIFPTAGT